MDVAESYNLGSFTVSQKVTGNLLAVDVSGSHDRDCPRSLAEYLLQLIELTHEDSITRVECHVEKVGRVLSGVQGALFRMVHGMRQKTERVTIFSRPLATDGAPHKLTGMLRILVDQMKDQPGAHVELVELECLQVGQ